MWLSISRVRDYQRYGDHPYNLEEEKEEYKNYKFYSTNIKSEEIESLKAELEREKNESTNYFITTLDLEDKLKIKEDEIENIENLIGKFFMAVPIAILLGIIITFMVL